jgi:hypothetical protein
MKTFYLDDLTVRAAIVSGLTMDAAESALPRATAAV